AALYDRFLIRALSDNLDSFIYLGRLDRGVKAEVAPANGEDERVQPLVSVGELRLVHARMASLLRFSDDFLARYKGLLFQIRSEGVSVSDRRAVKLLKLF